MIHPSIEAHNFIKSHKEVHYGKILKVLNEPMTALQIAFLTGLTQHQVSRRMSELIRLNRVEERGTTQVNRNGIFRGFTVYCRKNG